MDLQAGSILEGKVTTITKFGAFVSLEGGKSGLVHISEVANAFVNDVHDFLQEGQTVRVMVLSTENGKISLSVKKALPQQTRPQPVRPARPPQTSVPRSPRPQTTTPPQEVSKDQLFEDKLKQFLSSSEGKMADLNRNIAGKQGGKRRR